MNTRTEFSKMTKLLAFQRAKGCCEECNSGVKLLVGDIFYDHIIADGLGGDNSIDNCQVLCRSHHDAKTRKNDVPRIAKVKRIRAREAGVKKPRTIRAWRKFDGTPVYAARDRS